MSRAYFTLLVLPLFLLSFASFAEEPTHIPTVSLTAEPSTTEADEPDTAESTTISDKKISKSPNTSLAELLKSQSVVRLANNSGNSNQTILSIRGFGDNAEANSLILVDGFPLINSSLLAPNFNAILLSDIQKINIFEGSQGSLWGDQAVGGVMDVETKTPEKKFGNVNVGYGSFNQKYLNASFGDKFSNGFFYKILGFGSNTDNYRDHNQQANNGLSAEEGIEYAQGSTIFKENIYEDTIHFPGALTQAQYEEDPRQATDTTDYMHYKTQIYQFLNKHLLSDNWLLETRASSTNVQNYGFFFSPFNGGESVNWINPKLLGTINDNKITLGYSGQISNYESWSAQVSSEARASENDVYGQTIIPFLRKWDLTLGSRAAWQDNEPEIVIGEPIHYMNRVFVTEEGLVFHPTKTWSLFLRRDGNFRFPKTNEEVWLPTNVTELKPQTGVSYETGFAWKTPEQKTQLSVYELWLHNEIAYNPTQTPTQPFGATSNFDPTLRRGATLSEDATLTPKYSVNGQVNYVDARFVAGPYSGLVVPAVPKWNGNAGISYNISPHWKTNYNEAYTGTAFASDDIANIAPKASAYWLGQWSLQYFLKNFNVNFEINNLFNQRYAIYTVYDVGTLNDSYYPGAGRSYTLSFKAGL